MKTIRDLLINVRAGVRLALMLPAGRGAFRVSADQIVLLIGVCTALYQLSHIAAPGPDELRHPTNYVVLLATLVAFLFGCYLTTRVQGAQSSLATVMVLLLSAGPTFILVRWLLGHAGLVVGGADMSVYPTVGLGLSLLWCVAIFVRVVRMLFSPSVFRTAALAALYGLFVLAPAVAITWGSDSAAHEPDPAATEDPRIAAINVEETYYRQSRLMRKATNNLARERPGVTDLYFLGFAGDAEDDVFLKEVRSVTRLFDRRFDTRNRSVMLVNHVDTVRTFPLANGHNLFGALHAIGRRMNKDEDVLFLFLTSHGDREHNLAVRFGKLQLNAMPASYIRRVLDSTGIKWRVIVVSACFSGGFIDHLKDENSLIVTAARRDRASFGCGDAFDFTYFGQAYFDEALRRTYSFVEAFDVARASIAVREKQEDVPPSVPQIFIGANIGPKLQALEGRFVALGRRGPKRPLTNATSR